MKHQLLFLAATALVVTIGVRLTTMLRTTVTLHAATVAAATTEGEPPAIIIKEPAAHLESAAVRPDRYPALPEEIQSSLTNKSFLVINADTQEVLSERNSTQPLPLASLTKLLSAVVLSEKITDWENVVEILPEDTREGETVVAPGEKMSVSDLFAVTLIRSSNTGIMALVRVAGFSLDTMLAQMNQRAKEWGLSTTVITDPTGLSATTVGSARDVAVMLEKALQHNEIRSAVSRGSYEWKIYGQDGITPLRTKSVINTDELVHSNANLLGFTIEGGKTGFIPESRYHLAVEAQSDQRHRLVVVVLGARSFDARFEEAKRLLEWALDVLATPHNQT